MCLRWLYPYSEEITAENEEEIARVRFQQLLNERERDRIAAPWVTAAAAPRSGSARHDIHHSL